MKPVIYTVRAARALRRHANRAAAIREKIEQYAADPASLTDNVKALKGIDAKRLRVGDFRMLFRETEVDILVLDIGPCGSIYE